MEAHELVSHVLKVLMAHTRVGVRTLTLSHLAEHEMRKHGAFPYTKGYKPIWAPYRFPAAITISVNHEIAYGIPNEYRLKDGDIVTFDVGLKKAGHCADAAVTVGVGIVSKRDQQLLRTAKRALYAGIRHIRHGVKVREVSEAIEAAAKSKNFVVNRTFTGHGINSEMHTEPTIYHAKNWLYNNKTAFFQYEQYMDVTLEKGMVICLQPVITDWDRFGIEGRNRWTWITRDKKNAAMFEHMIKVTEKGCRVLTSHINGRVS